eukprot:4469743-Prymnesium_polylepis.1
MTEHEGPRPRSPRSRLALGWVCRVRAPWPWAGAGGAGGTQTAPTALSKSNTHTSRPAAVLITYTRN